MFVFDTRSTLGALLLSVSALTLASPSAAQAGTISGRVRDAVTGKALVGAEVRIAGHGSVRTADDGSFSAPRLQAGSYELTLQFPGYAQTTTQVRAPQDGVVAVTLEAQPSSRMANEVTVTGKYRQRSAAVLELQSPNAVSVLTSKELSHTPDENIASSLSRLPGLVALPGGFGNTNGVGVDLAGRGEANYAALRGLDPQFDINTINGVDVAQGQPYSRAVQLALLPPTGLQTVVVNKVDTPKLDGDAIGGLIDYRTPTAYDFAGRQSLTLEGGAQASGRAIDYGKNPLGGEAAISASRKFGEADQLGVYASGYYEVRNFSNTVIDGVYPAQTNGMWAFSRQGANGASAPIAELASNLTLTGLDVGYTTGLEERWGGSLSIDWRANDNLATYLRATYAHQSVSQESYYSQIYGNRITTQPLAGTPYVQPLIRYVQPRFYYETNPEEAMLSTYQAGAEARLGRLHLAPNLFASWGYNDEPDHFEFSARQPEVAPGYAYGQANLFQVSHYVPYPTLPAAELANIANIDSYGARRAGEMTNEFASQVKLGAKVDATLDFDSSWLQNLQFGAKFQSSNRSHNVRDFETGKLYTNDANDPTFGSLGVYSGSVRSIAPGYFDYRIPTISLPKAFGLFYSTIAKRYGGDINAISDECDGTVADSINCDTQRGIEQVSAAYLMGNIQLGDLQVMPGLRFEHTDISNTFYVIPANDSATNPGSFQKNHTTYNKPLPSISANYRPGPSSVYRAAIWTSYVRPSMFQLGGSSQVSTGDGVTTITQGNPTLKTIDAVNYDASGEWLIGRGGSASAAFFYKSLNHFIFSSVNSYTNQTDVSAGQDLVISTPLNGGSGHVYGLELAGRERFVDLPAPFDGFGVSGNMTLEKSGVHTGIPGLNTTERLLNQPDLAGNAQFFYERGPFDMEFSYRYVGPYVAQYGTALVTSSQLDDWVRENHRVDLHLGYTTPWRIHLDGAVGNLLNSNTYYETVGRHSNTIPSLVYSGRVYHLSAKYAF